MCHEALQPEEGPKEVEDGKAVAVENSSKKATQTSAKEVLDEFCPNSEYEFQSLDDFKAKPEPPKVSAKHPQPPPVRYRSLGGIDYYTVTYDDPSTDDDFYQFFAC